MEIEKLINGSAGLIAAIASLIGTIAALMNVLKNNRKERNGETDAGVSGKARKKTMVYFWGILALFIAVLIFTMRSCDRTPCIKITYPVDSSTVSQNEIVTGEAQNIPEDKSAWVVIIYTPDEMYLPNHTPVQIMENDEWKSEVEIGASSDRGKDFYIAAYLLDSLAVDELHKKFSAPDFYGTEIMPKSAVLCDKVIVKRN